MKNLFKILLSYTFACYASCSSIHRIPASSPTKLLCFTRSSPLVHQLQVHYSVLDPQAASISQYTYLHDLVFPDPSQLVVYTLSSLVSQSSMQEMLKKFVLSDKAQVSFQAWRPDTIYVSPTIPENITSLLPSECAAWVTIPTSDMFQECHCTGVVYNETAMLSQTFSPV